MPGLVPGIHVLAKGKEDVDGRDEPGHDDVSTLVRPIPSHDPALFFRLFDEFLAHHYVAAGDDEYHRRGAGEG